MYRLAETLLLVARYESGEQSTRRDAVDVTELARNVVADLKPLCQFKAIESAVLASKQVIVLADKGELKRAYRRYQGLPLFRSVKRDWIKEQTSILMAAGELEQMDIYRTNLRKSESLLR